MVSQSRSRIHERNVRPRISGAFRRALAAVDSQEGAGDLPTVALRSFGEELSGWRKHCERELKRRLANLEDDHPIKCEVGLFKPMSMHRAEVSHTRALAWLLNPRGEHGFGGDLLSALLKKVRQQADEAIFAASLVEAERFFRRGKKDRGRTDIWIEGEWRDPKGSKKGLVVIEAKIDSAEGKGQLRRYGKIIAGYQAAPSRKLKVFLTPKHEAAEDAAYHGWKPLSFQALSEAFLGCLSGLKGKPGYDFLRIYLAGVLSDILWIPIGRDVALADPYDRLQILEGAPSLMLKRGKPMAHVGRSLGFYLQHWDEMEYLQAEPKDARVESVAERANAQAEELLRKCAKTIENHFQNEGAATVKTKSQSRTIKRDWEIDVGLRPKRARRSAGFRLFAGAYIGKDNGKQPCLWLYLWAKGKGKTAREMGQEIQELTRKALKWNRTDNWYLDAAPFAKIALPVDCNFELDEAQIFRRLEAKLKKLGKREIRSFCQIR